MDNRTLTKLMSTLTKAGVYTYERITPDETVRIRFAGANQPEQAEQVMQTEQPASVDGKPFKVEGDKISEEDMLFWSAPVGAKQ